MDRKGQRHEIGKSTKRADRKRKRCILKNRYQAEKPDININISSKKLNSFGETNVIINLNISYRIINFIAVFSAISIYVKCKTCGGDVEFCEGNKRGLGFKIIIKCRSCVWKEINSCPLTENVYEVNRRFIFAMRMIGIGLAGAEQFCAFMDLPPLIYRSFYSTAISQICDATEAIKNLTIKKACDIEKQLTYEKCEKSNGLTVSSDSSWLKRSFSSLHGVVTVIDYYSKKVLDISVISSYCEECTVWQKKTHLPEYELWKQKHENKCSANHTDSAGKMEPDAMLEIFQRAEELHGVKYVNYIGDGDSKTYSKIVQQLPYNVQEKECINHVQKRMGTRLRNCKKNEKGLGGKGKLTDNLIKDLMLYYGLAIRRNSDSLLNMKKDIWATFFHKCSTDEKPKHDNCPTGKDSWCKWQKAYALGNINHFKHKPAMPKAVSRAIKPIYEDLARDDLLDRCLGAFDKNNNDSFNQIIWKIAPKSVFSRTSIVQIAANVATITFNNGYVALLDVLELLNIEIGQLLYDYCHHIDEGRIRLAEHQAYENTREARLCATTSAGVNITTNFDVDELLYGEGIAE